MLSKEGSNTHLAERRRSNAPLVTRCRGRRLQAERRRRLRGVQEGGLRGTAVFGGATNLVYAYAGQWMYFEMMTEMEAPADFPKAFLLPGPDHANWCINQ